MKTFLLVTSPKTDLWLVNPPVIMLAIGSALSLTLVEIIYVVKRVISPIYLADAFAELILIVWWILDLQAA